MKDCRTFCLSMPRTKLRLASKTTGACSLFNISSRSRSVSVTSWGKIRRGVGELEPRVRIIDEERSGDRERLGLRCRRFREQDMGDGLLFINIEEFGRITATFDKGRVWKFVIDGRGGFRQRFRKDISVFNSLREEMESSLVSCTLLDKRSR